MAWLNQSLTSSGQLSWATWGLAAACLSLCEDNPRRKTTLGAGAILLLLAFVLQMTLVYSTVRWDEWTYGWGTIA